MVTVCFNLVLGVMKRAFALEKNSFGGGSVGRYEALYSIAFLALGYALFKILNCESPMLIALLTPLIALCHELIHLAVIKILGLRYRLAFDRGKVGFVIEFRNRKEYLACALAPQALTLILMALSIFIAKELIVIAVVHVGMSMHDIMRSIKYAINPSLGR